MGDQAAKNADGVIGFENLLKQVKRGAFFPCSDGVIQLEYCHLVLMDRNDIHVIFGDRPFKVDVIQQFGDLEKGDLGFTAGKFRQL